MARGERVITDILEPDSDGRSWHMVEVKSSASVKDYHLEDAAIQYYVATNGSDANNGTSLATPFLTIQKCATIALAGDTCNIRAGIYRETVTVPRSGSSGSPIRRQTTRVATASPNPTTSSPASTEPTPSGTVFYVVEQGRRHGLVPIARHVHGEVPRQHPRQIRAHVRVVIDDQNARTCPRARRARAARSGRRRPPRWCGS